MVFSGILKRMVQSLRLSSIGLHSLSGRERELRSFILENWLYMKVLPSASQAALAAESSSALSKA